MRIKDTGREILANSVYGYISVVKNTNKVAFA